jgi:hypothetical protein
MTMAIRGGLSLRTILIIEKLSKTLGGTMNDNKQKKRANFLFYAMIWGAMPILFLIYCYSVFGFEAVLVAVFGLIVVALWVATWRQD